MTQSPGDCKQLAHNECLGPTGRCSGALKAPDFERYLDCRQRLARARTALYVLGVAATAGWSGAFAFSTRIIRL
jgi:hypothetical protein